MQTMRLLDHPNVVSLKHCFFSTTEKDELYLNLVLEYVPETVHRVIKHYNKLNQRMPLIYVKLYTYQIFRALSYIHCSIGVCHRDIKPQNLLVNPHTHQVKLCDFGSAKVLVKGEPNISYICSRYYRAPELIFGATEYTTAIDVWSAGCVLAELLLGQPLFQAKIGSKMRICSTCGGRGQVMRTDQTPFGMFSQVSVCPNCGGNGEVISEYCRKCSGEGRLRVKKNIKVKVPPGVSTGSILRVLGEGDAGPKGDPPGDLYVYLNVEEVSGIQRDGINLNSMVSVSYLDAILGSVVKVKTVEGPAELQIPPGTQPGDVLVLSKKGAPKLNRPSIRGDHLFTVNVNIPNRISTKERELLEELASLNSTTNSRPRTRIKAQMAPKIAERETSVESETNNGAANTEESGDQSDVWKQLKDLAGTVANGALKWLKDNL